MRGASFIATGFGIGYAPFFPGTAGSLVGLFIFLFFSDVPLVYAAPFLLILFGIGLYTATLAEVFLKENDPVCVVVDEIVAMLLTLFLLPPSPFWWVAGFTLFRIFDITKPPPSRSIEKLHGGLGIMADDLIAAGYTVIILRFVEQIGGVL